MAAPSDISGGLRITDEQALGENDELVGAVQQQLTSLSEGLLDIVGDLLLGVGDFLWGKAALVKYENAGDQLVIVPGAEQLQRPTERIMLMAPYRPGENKVHGACLQLYERDNEQVTDRFRVHFTDPGRRRIVGVSVDEARKEMKPIVHEQAQAVQASGGYWDCVGNCLRTAWDDVPWPLEWVCGGGCGACLFGGNPFGCSACAGCLGGYAAGCLARCA